RIIDSSLFRVPEGAVISALASLELPRHNARFPTGKRSREPSRTVSIVFGPRRAPREFCRRESVYIFVLDSHRRCTKPGAVRALCRWPKARLELASL